MPSLTREIRSDSPLGKRILSECRSRVLASEREISSKLSKWSEEEDKALAYIPESALDQKRRRRRENGLPEYTTIVIPYTYAVLMSAHTYLTSVFMGRSPIWQFSGRHGESMQSIQAMEALIDYQMMVGRNIVPLYIWLYDGLKYGMGVTGLYWEERVESCTQLTAQQELDQLTGQPTGREIKLQQTRQFVTYAGNRIRNVQPQSFLWDVRFPAWDFQRGEYVAEKFALTWNEIVRREKQGFYTNIDQIKGKYSQSIYQNGNMVSALQRPEANDPNYQTYEISDQPQEHPSMVKGYEVYIEIIPKEWGLGSSDYPEKWVFTCTGAFDILMGAQPLGAFHCKFPYSVLSLEPEAYGITTRGIGEILQPVQQTVDWLINSHFYNIRAALNNRWLADPSRIVMKDLLDPLPGGIVRLRPEAYGQDVKTVLHQFPVTDVTQNHLRDLQLMLSIGERTVGINDQIMGMLNAGGRKTATEVRTSTSFGVNRLKTIAEFFSASGFDPLAQMLVQNSQQYYDAEMNFRIAGDLINTAGAGMLTVTPDSIAGAYDFVPVDGTLPMDKYALTNLWLQIMTQARAMPEVMMGYDFARIFEWVAQLGGLKNITQFKVQLGSPEMLQKQALLGKMIPLGGRGQPGGPRGQKPTPQGATSPEPNQIPGMGASG
jgi:hypothetical protein